MRWSWSFCAARAFWEASLAASLEASDIFFVVGVEESGSAENCQVVKERNGRTIEGGVRHRADKVG